MATPAIDSAVRLSRGNSNDLDDVMVVMNNAFGIRFGEAWTRSQCAGILPMAGVSLMVARDREDGRTIGFSLSRTVADESELLLLAVLPDRHRHGIGGLLLDDFIEQARQMTITRSILKFGMATRQPTCIAQPVSSRLVGGVTITMRPMAADSTL